MASDHGARLAREGYTVFESVVSADAVGRLRASTLARLAALDYDGPRYAERMTPIGETSALSYSGVNFWRFLQECPEVIEDALPAPVLEVIREALGPTAHLELVVSAVADPTRGFLPWHTHIGGFDDSAYPWVDDWPQAERTERISTLLYLDDILAPEDGPLLVHPRTESEACHPRGPLTAPWPQQVAVPVTRGTVVALEQRTWHAALPMTRADDRIIVCCLFRRGDLPAPAWVDTSLHAVLADRPRLAPWVRPPAPGAPPPPMPCRAHLAAKQRYDARVEREGREPSEESAAPSADPPRDAAPTGDPTTLRAPIEDALRAVPGWGLVGLRADDDGLLLDLAEGGRTLTLEVAVAQAETRAYRRLGALAYSYRGSLSPSHRDPLPRVIEAVHGALSSRWP